MANQSYQTDNTLVNWADSDAVWGPLLFLRPKATEYLSVGRVAMIAGLLGCFQGMAVNFGMAAASRLTGQALVPVYVWPLTLSLALAVALSLSVGRAWNRRVDRLLRRQAWLENSER